MKQSLQRLFGLQSEEEETAASTSKDEVEVISVTEVVPNPFQPRTIFAEDKIQELAQSIKTHGLLQPITVRERGGIYEIVAGERRFRAVKSLGWSTIPALIKEFDDTITASLALIENLQRESLTAVEEATAYAQLIELQGLTQESLAQRLGKGQSTIANKLRLLHLPEAAREALTARQITERHARALLGLEEEEVQLQVLHEVIEKSLNVKQTEELIAKWNAPKPAQKKPRKKHYAKDTRLALNTIRQSLDMVEESGLNLETDEEEYEEYVQFTIRVPKK
ncbi:Effector of nucleoid occlusion Noc [Salsuginibacillus halophilus]|uniref:Effector of nucleoid occlusion Noc n=1 Tax=Salsuginibacillus halophilus TaxID=517424 RepID=A0A2P8HI77_9BACI|nr:nucleoid occlusion protein [Salsuginibacillus halophilus]PSL45934.1 Effector of nucleoid occlusion Noc [Salsuginibacillus halophilus]